MLGTLGAIAGGVTNLSDTAGTFESALKGFKNTEGNFFDKIKGGMDGVNDFQKGVEGNIQLEETNEKLQDISNTLSNMDNNNKLQMDNKNFNTALGDTKTFAPAKELTAIETSQDPLTQRASDAKRYEKFNAIAMGGIGLRQDSPFKMGVETTEAKTGMSEEDTKAAAEETTEEATDENKEKNSDKDKKKAAAAKGIADGLAAGFNAYASAIAQTDDEWWDENKNKSQKLEEFTVDFRPGKNSGANIGKGKGEIEPDITVGYGPDGKETKISRGIQASF